MTREASSAGAAVVVALAVMSIASTASADRVAPAELVRLHDQAVAWVAEAARLGDARPDEAAALRERARETLNRALRSDPAFARAAVTLGELLLELRRHDDAIRSLSRSLEAAPRHVGLKRILGIHLYRARRFERAERLLEEVAEADQGGFDVLYLLAGHYYRTSRPERALRHALAFLELRPDDVQVHGMVGNIYVRSGRLDLGVRAFRRVLKLDPQNVAVRVNLGNVLYRLGKHEEAIEIFQRVLAASPGLALVRYNLGSALFAQQRWAEALQQLLAFIDLEPSSARGHYLAGACLVELGRSEEAIPLLSRATTLDEQDARAPYLLARIALGRGDLRTAATFVTTALGRRPDGGHIRLLAGQVARHRKAYGEAIQQLERAVGLLPRSAEARAELGFSRILAGAVDEGIGDLESARTLDATEPRVLAWLPVARTRRAVRRLYAGDPVAAEVDLRRALEIRPDLADAAWNLALLRDALGDPASGVRVVQTALHHRPDDPNLRLLGAYLLVRIDEMDTAQAELQRSSGATDVGMRFVVQGALHGHFGEYDAAIAAFEHARENGWDAGAALHLARLDRAAALIRRGRTARAVSELQALTEQLAPALARVRAGLLAAALLAADTELERIEGLLSVVAAGPVEAGWGLRRLRRDADLLIGYARYRLGSLRKARIHLQAHLERHADDPRGRRLLASVLQDLAESDYSGRRYQDAEALARRAAELAPTDEHATHNLACVLYSRGDHVDAVRRFRMLRGTAGLPEATLNLALYLDDVEGKSQAALPLYRDYLSRPGIAHEIARRRVERKERIFGR